jgi:hypothetical protein
VSNLRSFLDLPPELLFRAHGDIKIICSEWGTPRPLFIDGQLLAQFRSGLSVFATCRQIYSEAATTMMSGNTWTVVRDAYHLSHHAGMVEKAAGAALWMLQLGSRLNMLTKVRIDLDQSCPTDCHASHPPTHSDFVFYDARYAVHLGSLIKLLWANPDLLPYILFVHPQG